MNNILKKILLTSVTAISLMANSTTTNHIGLNFTELGNYSGNGLSYNIDKTWEVKNGFGIGGRFGFDYLILENSLINGNTLAYNTDLQLLIGYNFNSNFNIPVNISAGIGYGITLTNASNYYDGIIYSISSDYNFTDKFGIGITYRTGTVKSNTSIKNVSNISKSNTTLSFAWKY